LACGAGKETTRECAAMAQVSPTVRALSRRKARGFDAPRVLGYVATLSQGMAVGWQAEAATGEPPVLWSVVQEHLDEAGFGLERFEALLNSPILTLENLADIEALLDAHVDGLVIGGKAVAERLLLPLLIEGEAELPRVTAAALTLLASGDIAPVATALGHASPLVRKAVLRAGELGASSRLDAALSKMLASSAPGTRGVALQLAAARRLAIPALAASLACSEEDEQVGALRAASPQNPQELTWVEHLMGASTAPRVREAAMLAGLEYGSHQAWSLCQANALRAEHCNPLALALFAGLADPTQQALLYSLTQSETHKYAAFGCLGYTGSVGLVPWLIQQAASEDDRTAKLAGEAFFIITGAPQEGLIVEATNQPQTPSTLAAEDEETQESLPPLEQDDLDADLAPSADDALPRPDARALEAWWQANGSRFDARFRYLAGAPLTFDAFRRALETFPLRQRHVLSALIAIRTAGATRIDTRGFTRAQRAQMAELPSAQTPWARQYSGF
jgi:uncharacterized protein (TIGR02270 family)